MSQTRTPAQNKALFGLFSRLGMDETDRHQLASQVSGGRTQRTSQLTAAEADTLLRILQAANPLWQSSADRMRKKIIAMAHDLGWHHYSPSKGRFVADMARIDQWCQTFSQAKKGLNAHTEDEMPQLVSQFERMYSEHFDRAQKQTAKSR